ncbi:hypothetical protein JB92DRAFT_2899808 [Gautieria morchelliformis]|nr:hypothetical protein JB92DRAFT_2899808 [Gautieria morchelliformis]
MDGDPLCVVSHICSTLLYNIYSTSGLLVNFDVLIAVSVFGSTIFVLAASVPVGYVALSIVSACYSQQFYSSVSIGHKQTVSNRACTALLVAKLASSLPLHRFWNSVLVNMLTVSDYYWDRTGRRCGPIQIRLLGNFRIIL